jgi:hypothetical protein
MEMTGEVRIPAPRARVWQALNDVETLKACIPGCEELLKLSDTEMTAKVKQKIGPVSASFAGKITLSDLNPPESYAIIGEGTGGVAGFAKGGATVKLTEDGPAATVLAYQAKAQVGGKLAQLGGRLIDATAKALADQFFKSFGARVSALAAASAPMVDPSTVTDWSAKDAPEYPSAQAVSDAVDAATAMRTAELEAAKPGIPKWVWAVAAAAALALAAAYVM